MYVVKWISGNAKGYDDHIPEFYFKAEGYTPLVEHTIVGPSGWLKIARCSLTVAENFATFDYDGDHRTWNEKEDFYIGQMRFAFDSSKRIGIPRLFWKDDSDREFVSDYGYVAQKTISKAITAGAKEGDKKLAIHIESERYPLARLEKLTYVMEKNGKVSCEACNTEYQQKYGPGGLAAYEVHHRKPIKDGVRITNLSDLAILCANCHRMIHSKSPIQSVEAFKKTILR